MKYKIKEYMNGMWDVYDEDNLIRVFRGSLLECEAYIRLKEGWYID